MYAKKSIDVNQVPTIKLIFSFAIPIVLTTLAQNFFNIADKAVLGNMAGSIAMASIGATSAITSLVINGAVGLSTGAAIVLARFLGQKNEKEIRSTVDTALLTGLFLGIIVAVLGNILAPFFLKATGCLPECYEGSLVYVRIYISGAPVILFYNYGAAILRTLGDTRRPLFYIILSGIVNVALNIILCLILPQKVVAVAIATVVSKIISSALVARRLMRLEGSAKVTVRQMRFGKQAFRRIFRFGIPVSISNMILPLANLQIVSAINSFGVAAIAGNSAANSVQSVVGAFVTGFSAATSTFMGQNIGAKKPDYVKRSFWYSISINALVSGSLGLLMYLTGEFWLGLILGVKETAAIEYGMVRMFFVTLFVFVHAISDSFGKALQAFGYPVLTSVTNIVSTLGFRIMWMQVIYPKAQSFEMLMLCFTISWILKALIYGIFFAVVYWRYVKKGICKKV